MIRLWMRGLLTGRSGRLFGAIAGVGLTIALIVAIGTFTASASRTMTQRAIAGVPVDWQIELRTGADLAAVNTALAAAAPITEIRVVSYGRSTGLHAVTGLAGHTTEQTTGPARVLGLPADYATVFPHQVELLLGTMDGALVAQQTASNLHVGPGDRVTVGRAGQPPATVTISGVVSLPNADSMFQLVGVVGGTGPSAPPDNVLLLPDAEFHALFDAQAASLPGSVRTQLHVRLAHGQLPPNPGAAFFYAERAAHNLEARTAGSVVVGNNLAARLAGARADALYSRVLFLFLGGPGVILAILFTLSIAGSGAERRRHEQALLRTRGASIVQILRVAGIEAAAIGAGGVVFGLLLAGAAALAWWDLAALRAASWWVAAAVLVGLSVAVAGMVWPAWREASGKTVAAAKATLGRRQAPLWERLYLDLGLLVVGAGVYWLVASSGYQVVVAPEGVPQTSVHYEAFLAPLCLWVGAGLLAMRLTRLLLTHGRALLTRALKPLAADLSPLVAASLDRQRDMLARGTVMVALAFAFAVSTAVFGATYLAQSRMDAELTNGSDVTVTGTTATPAGPLLARLAKLPGVTAAEPMTHRFAYVGSDLQDIFGIDPAKIGRATPMRDAYFTGATAAQMMDRLASRHDGILVAQETVNDYQLRPGDLLNLRLQHAPDHSYRVVPFHYVGIAREFPTAPKDSLLVANATYIAEMTGTDAAEVVLLRTAGDGEKVATAARALALAAGTQGVGVTTLGQAQRLISSSLTAVDLRGLTSLELGFAVLMITGVTGLMLALGLAERRRSFTILAALGAKPWQLGAFLWSEVLVIVGLGALCGTAIGFLVAQVLVRVLSGVFDPPPDTLSIPWLYLLIVLGAAVVCSVVAVLFMRSLAARPDPYALRHS
jgi:putative ABC transport system permease protein